VVAQIQIGKNAVLGKEIIADGDLIEQVVLGELLLLGVPVHKEEYLGLEPEPGGILVEIREERILLGAFEDDARVQLGRKERCETGLSHTDRPVDHDVPGMATCSVPVHGVFLSYRHLITVWGSFSSRYSCETVLHN